MEVDAIQLDYTDQWMFVSEEVSDEDEDDEDEEPEKENLEVNLMNVINELDKFKDEFAVKEQEM